MSSHTSNLLVAMMGLSSDIRYLWMGTTATDKLVQEIHFDYATFLLFQIDFRFGFYDDDSFSFVFPSFRFATGFLTILLEIREDLPLLHSNKHGCYELPEWRRELGR